MKKIVLAGNPNVGKSTVFNALTGMHQHTGNWTGKTVDNAYGEFKYKDEVYQIYDLPGTYSLIAHSYEEEVARNFICFEKYDSIIVVCDATCLERNLNLVLQILEITNKVVVCVNLMDEAKKKNIEIDLSKLSNILNVPVVGTSATKDKDFSILIENISNDKLGLKIKYPEDIEDMIDYLLPNIENKVKDLNPRWVAVNLISNDKLLNDSLKKYLDYDLFDDKIIKLKLTEIKENSNFDIKEKIVSNNIKKAEAIAKQVVSYKDKDYTKKDRKIDKLLTNKITGISIMILMLITIFYLTINGANYPSSLLFELFAKLEIYLIQFLNFLHFPSFLVGLIVDGIYKVLTWVISVMLPPMAIFFPLFTLLEDLGFLPRISFNLDKIFKKCNACGKQALTMCMGFGCNAVGVTGARIIDSKRERLIAILTNVFVPCNGRFPTIISIISMFLIGITTTFLTTVYSTAILVLIIVLGISLTFLVSYILSKTILKGYPTSFTLELPPYRKPQIGKVIIRSIFDRTIFVLGRSIIVAAPAGALIWLLANINISGDSLLVYISNFLNPFGNMLGLDGVILLAFILGFPANEIVIPIMLMCYLQNSSLIEFENLHTIKNILLDNGWTIKTAICMLIFTLCHFPCSTTCLTIKKETGSWKWTLLAMVLPTIIGIILCFLINILCIVFIK